MHRLSKLSVNPNIFCIFASAYARIVGLYKKSIARLSLLSNYARLFYEGGLSIYAFA